MTNDVPVSFFCRRMQKEDLPACAAIESCVQDGWSEASLADELLQESARMFVACTETGAVAALAVFQLVCGEANLCALSTAPALRRCGAARTLLSHAIKALSEEKAESIFLEVRAQNAPARDLYDSIGFVSVGLRKGFYSAPADDAVLMQKILPDAAGSHKINSAIL